jgi:hypothetical protein
MITKAREQKAAFEKGLMYWERSVRCASVIAWSGAWWSIFKKSESGESGEWDTVIDREDRREKEGLEKVRIWGWRRLVEKDCMFIPPFCQNFGKGGNLAKTAKPALLKKVQLPLKKSVRVKEHRISPETF